VTGRWYAQRWFAVRVAVGAAAVNTTWVLLDRSTPSFDQASYLTVAIQYNQAVDAGGLDALPDTMTALDPARGPLYVLLLMPVMAVLGNDQASGLWLNALIAPVLYVAAGEVGWRLTRSWLVRLLAILLVAGTPILVGLQHDTLVDFLLAALAALSVWGLLVSDHFLRRWPMVGAGVAMGLGTLTKVTFPAFVVGPAVVSLLWALTSLRGAEDGKQVGRRCANLAIALALYLVIVLPWYLPHLDATREYIKSTTGGALAAGAGPENPLTWHNLVSFNLAVFNQHLSWLLVLAGVVVLLAHVPTFGRHVRSPGGDFWWRLAWLATWIAVPYVLLMTGSNQDVRLMAPAFVGIAVALAAGLGTLRPAPLRIGLAVATCAALAFQTANRVVPLGPGWLPATADVVVGDQYVGTPIASSSPLGYERLPRRDRATPVIDWIEERADRDAEGRPTGVVCLLAAYPFINNNTFRYLNLAHEDTFQMSDVRIGPGGEDQLAADLSTCDFALYVPPVDDRDARLEIVNDPFAANHMTPRLFDIFDGPSKKFPMGEQSRARSDAWPPDTSEVEVLSQR
jgi:hypothetical protein